MAKYLLIESRDPFDSNDCAHFCLLAERLAAAGNDVTFFPVQNGVLPARSGAQSKLLADLAAAGVVVLADSFALAERGICTDKLIAGVAAAPLDIVVDQLAEGRKAIWH